MPTRHTLRSLRCTASGRGPQTSIFCFALGTPMPFLLATLPRSEEHTSELQSLRHLVCRLLLEPPSHRLYLHSFPTRRSSDLIREIGKAVAKGRIDLTAVGNMDADAAHAALTALHGVGPWTADIYLLFCLGHADAFPSGDLAEIGRAHV